MKLSKQIKRFLADDSGSVAMEYGMLTGLVSATAIVGLEALGQETSALFAGLAHQIDSVVSSISR